MFLVVFPVSWGLTVICCMECCELFHGVLYNLFNEVFRYFMR